MFEENFSRRDGLETAANDPGRATVTDRPPKQLAFSVVEYRDRVRRVQRDMAAQGLDALLLTVAGSVCYITGYETLSQSNFYLVIVPQSGDPLALMRRFESYNAWLYSWLEDGQHTLLELDANPIEETRLLLERQGLANKKLGIEIGPLTSMPPADYLRLKGILPQAALVDASNLVPWVRAIKSPAEIAYHRDAGRISSAGTQAAIDAARAGVTDNDVAAAAAERLYKEGSEYMCYQPIVTTGRRSGVPHSTFHRVPIREGDHVFMEFGASVCRYSSPIMRVVMMGEPTSEGRRMAEACLRSVDTMAETIKPGLVGGEVAEKCEKAMGSLPSNWLWHGYYGYSVGLGFPPEWSDCLELNIMKGGKTVLQPGMVFHCSTSIRDPGVMGTTFSETMTVTEHGCEVLTTLPRVLIVKT